MKLKEVMRFWDGLAESSLEDRLAIGAPGKDRFVNIAINGSSVLDVGVGYGRYAIPLANEGKFVVGVDVSLGMLRRLRRYSSDVHVILASGTHLPFKERVFDAVISLATLYYIPGWERVICEISRVLKEGGVAKLDFRGYSLKNVLREIVLRSLKKLGVKKPWLYAVENRLTTWRHLTKVFKESSLIIKLVRGNKTRFLVEVVKR